VVTPPRKSPDSPRPLPGSGRRSPFPPVAPRPTEPFACASRPTVALAQRLAQLARGLVVEDELIWLDSACRGRTRGVIRAAVRAASTESTLRKTGVHENARSKS